MIATLIALLLCASPEEIIARITPAGSPATAAPTLPPPPSAPAIVNGRLSFKPTTERYVHVVECSEDLQQWKAVATNVCGVADPVSVPCAPSDTPRFFRTRSTHVIERHFTDTDTASALYITDTAASPANACQGDLLRIDVQASPIGANHPIFRVRNGTGTQMAGGGASVQVWDSFAVCPSDVPGQVLPIAMLGVYTDTDARTPIIAVHSNRHHPSFAVYKDAAGTGSWDDGVLRWEYAADGTYQWLPEPYTPLSSSEAGKPGQVTRDDQYLYFWSRDGRECRRVPLELF